ncbi:MAG: M20/M25/M40 family metallo-hydrolase [Chloroflexota bacterium]|nr:M20/M25/M40 family metallo-hydrolase [Chloroflexota bacterium]
MSVNHSATGTVETPDPELVARVVSAVEERRGLILDFFRDLVRIPSETHPPGGDEGPAQGFVAERMRAIGLQPDVFEPWSVPDIEQHPGWWPGLDYSDRPNVVGVWRGSGSGRSLILNGHIDVVPAGDRTLWRHDPYGAEMEDGLIYGRGTADQKIGIAAMLMAVQTLSDLGLRPGGDVTVESVVNEELGGYNGTLACCAKGYRADAAIVTEATDFAVGGAQKGGQVYRMVVPGEAYHHAVWERGASALDHAILLKEALVEWERLRQDETRTDFYYGDGARALHPRAVHADTVWYLQAGDPAIMANPTSAELRFWVDHLPGEDREEMLRRFEEHVLAKAARHPYLKDHPPLLERAVMRPFTGVAVAPDAPLVRTLRAVSRAVLGRDVPVVGLEAATDAMIFNLYSETPAVIYCGGTFSVAHAPDEHVSADDVITSTSALALAILQFCGTSR